MGAPSPIMLSFWSAKHMCVRAPFGRTRNAELVNKIPGAYAPVPHTHRAYGHVRGFN